MSILTGTAESGNPEISITDESGEIVATSELHKLDAPQFAATILSLAGEEELAQLLGNQIYARSHYDKWRARLRRGYHKWKAEK